MYSLDFTYYMTNYLHAVLVKYIHPKKSLLDYKYKTIINDPIKFYPFSNREPGGIYFSYDCKELAKCFPKKFKKRFVTLPNTALVYFDKPSGALYYQFKTNQIILTK